MNRKTSIGISILFLSLFHQSSHAIPITWVLQDVTFIDGGTATGSFVYDADIFEVISINVETTPGSQTTFDSTPTYNVAGGGGDIIIGSTVPIDSDLTDQFDLSFLLRESLTNAGGTIPLFLFSEGGFGGEALCANFGCSEFQDIREIVSGSVSAVPIPTAVWLFGSALVGLGIVRKKRRA